MLTFFQHFLIGKMEEETHNDEEELEQPVVENREQEHASTETPDSDSAEPVEEVAGDDIPAEQDSDMESREQEHVPTETPNPDSAEPVEEVAGDDIPAEQDSDMESREQEHVPTETPDPDSADPVEEVAGDDAPTEQSSDVENGEQEHVPTETPEAAEAETAEVTSDAPESTPTEEDQISKPLESIEPLQSASTDGETAESEAASDDKETPGPSEPEVSYKLGTSEEVYDFVAMFEDSTYKGAEQVSASLADSAGGVKKPALFGHPSSTDAARINYELALPSVAENEALFLHFSVGLRDGIVFDDAERPPGGVKFCIEISGEPHFDAVSTECRWAENGIELTDYADKTVNITFITHCNVEGNSSYAWALWGKPTLLKLTTRGEGRDRKRTRTRGRGRRRAVSTPELQCGIAIAEFDENQHSVFTFNRADFTPASEIAGEIYKQLADEPLDLTLYAAQPRLEIVSVGATSAVVGVGEAFEVQCTLKNTGAGPLTKDSKTRLSISELKLKRDKPTHNVNALAPGETTTLFWQANGISHSNSAEFSVTLKSQQHTGEKQVKGTVDIRPVLPKLETKVIPELHTYKQDEHVVMGNKHLRIVLVHNGTQRDSLRSQEIDIPEGFEYYAVFVAKGNTYHQVATSKTIAEATYISQSKEQPEQEGARTDTQQNLTFVPSEVYLSGNSLGEAIVRLSDEQKDADGVTWTLQLLLTLTEDARRIKAAYRLTVDSPRELLAFRGTEIYAGHKSMRDKKAAALFPGLEFLENEEPSSNPRDAAPPLNNRLVPHPYKITVPVMAVELQKSIVGIAWNPLESWDGEEHNVSAVFASPNSYHREKNHLMGLFLPTVPKWVKENERVAETAYTFTPERPISLACEIIADGNTTILDAVTHWTSAYGTPAPLNPPRSDEEELLLSRHGFMDTTWDAEARQSRHCADWPSQNEPGFATLLWYDYLITKSDPVKARVMEIADKTVAEGGPAALVARGSCHILSGEFPFYVGHLEAALAHYEDEVAPLLSSQAADGSWAFQPASERTESLGTPGDVVLGTCAVNALKLLKHARITGNSVSLEAGKKALAFMNRFSVPRGAQTWECPLYEPDILAAAYAIGAYIEAHEITGNKSYLKRAEYWAKAGLPFLYHWYLPDRPGMLFGSIPVFGTTFHTHPWFGVPVQWNGLVYAYYLQQLDRHKRDEKWRDIAEGITISAMYQQWTEGELKGTYPDGFYGFCTEGKGPHLNPEDIMVNVYTLRGLDPGIKTAIAGSIHLSSGAKPEDVNTSRKGELKWTLNYAENEISHTLITGYGQAPSLIRAHPTHPAQTEGAEHDADKEDAPYDIPQVESLEDVTSGWRYLHEKDAILIKQLHSTAEMQFQLLK